MKPPGQCDRVILSPDGKLIATHDTLAKFLVLYDRDKREEVHAFDCPGHLLGFTPDGKRLVTMQGRKPAREKARWEVCLWSVSTGKRPARFDLLPRHGELRPDIGERRLLYAISDKEVIVVGEDRVITSYDLKAGKRIGDFPAKGHRPKRMALSRDGKWLLTAGEGNELRVWDTAKRQLSVGLYEHDEKVSAVAISPDGAWCASLTGKIESRIWVFDRKKKAERARAGVLLFAGDNTLSFSADGKMLFATGDGAFHGLNVWEWQHHKQIHGYPEKGRFRLFDLARDREDKWKRGTIGEANVTDDGTLLTRAAQNDVRLWFAKARKTAPDPDDPEPPSKPRQKK